MKPYYFGYLNWNAVRYFKEKADFVNDFLEVSASKVTEI
jgi:hypothetical protein